MATAKKQGKSYKITASHGYDATGKQIRRHMTWTPDPGMTTRQIEKELARQCVLFDEHVHSDSVFDSSIRFKDFAEKWMGDYSEKQLKTKTLYEYQQRLVRIYQAIGHIKLKDIRTGHLNSFYANLEETGIRADKKYITKIDLLTAIKARSQTRTLFSRNAGISLGTMRSAIDGKKIDSTTASAIAVALGMKLPHVFAQQQPERTLSPNTIRTYHRIISSCLGKAVKWGYIPNNPATHAQLPKMDQQEAPIWMKQTPAGC